MPVILVADDDDDDNDDSQTRPPALPQHLLVTQHGVQVKPQVVVDWVKPLGVVERFLIHSFDHGGGGLVAQALNLFQDEVFLLFQPLYKLRLLNKEKVNQKTI